MRKQLFCAAICAATAGSASAADFGKTVEALANLLSPALFGTIGILDKSSSASLTAAAAEANPAALVTAAKGLKVSVVSAHKDLGPNIDMMVLWPQDHPTHLIACNEQGTGQVAVQRINLATGVPENIISSGLTSCDPVRATPWGTVIVGEEAGTNGRIFEIIDPLNTNNVTITGQGAATVISDTAHVARRGALGQMSFEGNALFPNGVIYSTDENRPSNGNPGGAIVKFIPSTLWTGTQPISDLSQSPFVDGTLWGFRAGRRSAINPPQIDFGQGNEFGRGYWVKLPESRNNTPTNLRAEAAALKLTSYYRPEDMDIDLVALEEGNVRFCGTNTGEDTLDVDNHFGEVYCFRDGTVAAAGTITEETQTLGSPSTSYQINVATVPEYQPLVIGNVEFAMMDNIAYQPGRGNWIVHEDGEGSTYTPKRNNDIWDCLDDGGDNDNLSDACVRVITLNDLTAESTGGLFDPSGKTFYFSVQHNITLHGVILKVTGWK